MITRAIFCVFLLTLSLATHGVEVTKANWISSVSTVLPTIFCNSNQYFRQCFNVTVEECEEVAASATRVCLNKNQSKIPSTLIQPQDGTHWGTVIGTCAGTAYEVSLSKKRVKNEKCNNPKNWQ